MALFACSDSSGTGDAGPPAAMEVLAGNEQEGTVGEELGEPLQVRVTDDRGRPVRGQLVNWRVVAGGGSVFAGSSITDHAGVVQERWTLGTVAGAAQQVEARAVDNSSGEPLVFATFAATAEAGPVSSLSVVTTETLEGTAGQPLATQVVARATDQYDNPVPGVTVMWQASAGGSASPATSTTDGAGEARTTWTLGAATGAQELTARSGTLAPATFAATARAGGAAALEIVSGNERDGVVGMALSEPLVVRAVDAIGNGVADVLVTWRVQSGGGSLSTESSATDAEGLARTTWTLGTTTGQQSAGASAEGVEGVTFTATARSGAPSRMEIVSGDNQRGPVGTALAEPLVFRMYDRHGNAAVGAVFLWRVISADGGEIAPERSVTNDAGEGTGRWTLGERSGELSAAPALEVGHMDEPYQSFSAYGLPIAATRVELVSGGEQAGVVATTLAAPIVVRALDAYGTPVSGIDVSFATSDGGTLAPVAVTTNDEGLASSRWLLGTRAGTQTVTASSGAGTATITARALAAAPAAMTIVSGDGQEGVAGTELALPLVVRLADQFGNPTEGISISWAVSAGGGTLVVDHPSTFADGQARARWVLGSIGENQVTATAGSLSATFRATASAGEQARLQDAGLTLTQTPPGGGAETVYAQYTARVRLVGADGTPIANADVTWTATGGGSASPTTRSTDASGYATTSWRLGTTVGENTLAAQAPGVEPLTYRIVTRAGPMCSGDIRAEDGSSAVSGRVGGLTDRPLFAFSRDQFGNPTGGYSTSPYPYPTDLGYTIEGSFSTDATGRSQPVYVRVGTAPGTQEFVYPAYICQGTSFGLLTPRLQTYRFQVGAYAGPAERVEVGSGDGQIGAAGSTLAYPLVVRLYDSYGNLTTDGVVTWQVVSGGGSLAPSSGGHSADWTLGSSVGEQRVRASLANGASVVFTATAVAP